MPTSPLDFINAINQQVSQLLPDVAKTAQDDISAQAKAARASLATKLDLVTREEFDVQQQVLLRTREKLELLEKRVAVLEKQLSDSQDE